MNRRAFLVTPVAALAQRAVASVSYPQVAAGATLSFPRDHGSHPAFRTEWWYITGWVRTAEGRDYGVQITFFRSRPGVAEGLASAFAARQVIFAHAAIADAALGRLRHDQRAARAGFGLAEASERTTDVKLDDWSLALREDDYRAVIPARDFTLDLAFRATQPILLQGEQGISRKGPSPAQASFYYSRPQLEVTGKLGFDGKAPTVRGVAWLDHEWSSEYLAAQAQGWEWTGINFDDGSALMAFRIRDHAGETFWAGGSYRDAEGNQRTFAPHEVKFESLRRWRSPRTAIEYPVAVRITTSVQSVVLEPLFDDQELDARATVGTVYWEGAARALQDGIAKGRGYLELTGYGQPLRL